MGPDTSFISEDIRIYDMNDMIHRDNSCLSPDSNISFNSIPQYHTSWKMIQVGRHAIQVLLSPYSADFADLRAYGSMWMHLIIQTKSFAMEF